MGVKFKGGVCVVVGGGGGGGGGVLPVSAEGRRKSGPSYVLARAICCFITRWKVGGSRGVPNWEVVEGCFSTADLSIKSPAFQLFLKLTFNLQHFWSMSMNFEVHYYSALVVVAPPEKNWKGLVTRTYTFGGPGMQLSSSLFTFQSYLNFARMRYAQI